MSLATNQKYPLFLQLPCPYQKKKAPKALGIVVFDFSSCYSFYTAAWKLLVRACLNLSADIHIFGGQLQNWISGSSWWKWVKYIIILVVMLFSSGPCVLNCYLTFISSYLQLIHTQMVYNNTTPSICVTCLSSSAWKSARVENINPSMPQFQPIS